MRGISEIYRDLPLGWQLKGYYDDLYARRQELDAQNLRSHIPSANEGSWNFRSVRPVVTALPLLLDTAQTFYQRKPSYQHPGQTISQGLSDMFMAHDRFRREQLLADLKEHRAEREYAQGLTLDAIQDLTSMLHHHGLMAELTSQVTARELETSRQIIHNI